MIAEKFHPGDRVVFRDWDDMAEEFGTDGDSVIRVPLSFTKDMRHLCGREFTVRKCGTGVHVYLEESTAAPGSSREWSISTGMLRLAGEDWDDGFSAGDFLSELI